MTELNRRSFLRLGAAAVSGPSLAAQSSMMQAGAPHLPSPGTDGWISLLNGHDLSGWYSILASSGRDVAEKRGIVRMEEGMLHIYGSEVTAESAEAGYLATVQEFGNVHIRVEFKWGLKRFPPRSLCKRDNGLLYGLVGADKVWPTCVECQIQEGDVGDFFLLGGVRGVQDDHGAGLFGQGLEPNGWPERTQSPGNPRGAAPEPTSDRRIKDGNFEILDDWNVVEVIWQGDRAANIVNGRTVNSIFMLQKPDPQNSGRFIALTRGKIAIEIEYAEIWFRRIEVKPLT